MFTPTPVVASLKRRNSTSLFQVDKAADCSLYLAANVALFLSKKGCCLKISTTDQDAEFDKLGVRNVLAKTMLLHPLT